MNEKEVAEIRRRYRPEKSNITHIRGCCVNENREIVSEFNQSVGMMAEDEAEKALSVLKRTLSGTLGKNLIDISFSTQQVADSPEHRALMELRSTGLEDDEAVENFFRRVIGTVTMEGNYLILLTYDKYDVPYKAKDGENLEDAASEVFSYILCSICPIKTTKPALSYSLYQNEFHSSQPDWLVAPPELGFLFPAFDDRSTNIYNALYYSRDPGESHQEFVDTVFHTEIPIPAEEQKEVFHSILTDTLAEDCSYEVVQAVHDQLCGMIADHKESKEEQPLVISKGTVKQVLETCGVSEEHLSAFEEKYDAEFGEEAELPPKNIIDEKQFELRTPDVTIRVNPERSDLVETRMIDGKKYILVRADENVEVNGVPVRIS